MQHRRRARPHLRRTRPVVPALPRPRLHAKKARRGAALTDLQLRAAIQSPPRKAPPNAAVHALIGRPVTAGRRIRPRNGSSDRAVVVVLKPSELHDQRALVDSGSVGWVFEARARYPTRRKRRPRESSCLHRDGRAAAAAPGPAAQGPAAARKRWHAGRGGVGFACRVGHRKIHEDAALSFAYTVVGVAEMPSPYRRVSFGPRSHLCS